MHLPQIWQQEHMLKAWKQFDKERTSENDNPRGLPVRRLATQRLRATREWRPRDVAGLFPAAVHCKRRLGRSGGGKGGIARLL